MRRQYIEETNKNSLSDYFQMLDEHFRKIDIYNICVSLKSLTLKFKFSHDLD